MPQTCRLADLSGHYAAISLAPGLWRPGLECSICGSPILADHYFNRDHIVPIGAGGSPGKKNCAFAHTLCNMVKGSNHPFSLRTRFERRMIKYHVRAVTYALLVELWASTEDTEPHTT